MPSLSMTAMVTLENNVIGTYGKRHALFLERKCGFTASTVQPSVTAVITDDGLIALNISAPNHHIC